MEESVKPTETVTAVPTAAPATVPAATPKKKANILVILLVVFGILGILCAACAGLGVWGMRKALQVTPQAVAVNTLFEGLNEGDPSKVNNVSGEKLYADLYQKTKGTSLADELQGAFSSIKYTSVNIEDSKANVEFTITGKGANKKFIETITYAELQSDSNGWFVTYIGQKSDK